ncbi:hypothetical protein IGI37_003091 [Enterococcus sp. AZ194]|uniref:GNAT family N-acetyltransferase n=1 Tax=Enterococcus sp. AZ194 TaxID=2774629 RepID=UPI003F2138BC
MEIKVAAISEYTLVEALYYAIIEQKDSLIGWEKDVYPSKESLIQFIKEKELLLGIENNEIVAAMVLNHACNKEYQEVEWTTEAKNHEVIIVHMLGVHPRFKGKGYAKQMIYQAIDYARKNNQKAIRLDVLEGNIPAENLYTGLGFRYIDSKEMFYEDTGWTNFKLYEYNLS